MRIIADFHIHSKFSRATSKDMDLDGISKFSKLKGIDLMGTGDFTHPAWLSLLKGSLELVSDGIFSYNGVNFILTGEVSNIFKQKNTLYKIHLIIFSPSFSVCEKINEKLAGFGSLWADGRPILSLSAKDLVKLVVDIDERCFVVPAHIWTPHFSLFGANSGFDTIEDCFEEETDNIYALETGLSSDPGMNWRLSALDRFCLISNSDAHSPQKLGREANILECEMEYDSIISAMKRKRGFLMTLEFFPEEGKYHYDGHRFCQIRFSPEETKRSAYICPRCKKRLTVGVMHRVDSLSDRPEGFVPENSIPYKNIIPLDEIIAASAEKEPTAVGVKREYISVLENGVSEFDILLNLPREELERFVSAKVAQGILNVRERRVEIAPGYDGVYGKIDIFKREEEKLAEQMSLF
jgi:uncharacterized protein (TIGR00375 family)